jgi:hypothetical protein
VQHVLNKRFPMQKSAPLAVGGWLFTMLFYLVSLAFFRCPDVDAAGVMVRAMFGQSTGAGTQTLRASLFVIGTAAALLLTWIASREGWLPALRMPAWRLRPIAFGAAASAVVLIASVAAPTAGEVFFYFQF